MKKIVLAFAFVLAFASCERVKQKANDAIDSGAQKVESAIDSGAQVVGETATDVVNSIDKGITKSSKLDIQLSDALKKSGLSFGKYYFSNGVEGKENVLSLYLITEQNTDRELRATLFDKKGVEMGRTKVKITQKAGDAAYHDFVFDPKISFEYQGKMTIE